VARPNGIQQAESRLFPSLCATHHRANLSAPSRPGVLNPDVRIYAWIVISIANWRELKSIDEAESFGMQAIMTTATASNRYIPFFVCRVLLDMFQ